MFYGRMQSLTLESPQATEDSYNHKTVSWTDEGTVRAYIVLQDANSQNDNDLITYATNLVGYTQDLRPERGWRIGGRYVIESVVPHRTDKVLYLREVENGG